MVKLIGLVGTNSKKSTNRQLLQYIQKHFSEQAEIELVEIKDIPMFNKPTPKVVPQEAQAIADKIAAADGVIISTPEYDHLMPSCINERFSMVILWYLSIIKQTCHDYRSILRNIRFFTCTKSITSNLKRARN